jgi:hypothetical protein
MKNMAVTLNQGLRNFQEAVTHKIGSLNITINLFTSALNILIQIPTLNTSVHIMSPILIYNYQLRSSGGVFRGAKLYYFPTLYKKGELV